MTDQKHTKELFLPLPCPFCGDEPYQVQIGNDYTKRRGFDIGCKACRFKISDRVLTQTLGWCRLKNIENWNKRPNTGISELTKQRDELREALEKIQDSIPAHINGDFIIEHFDGVGNYAGTEQIDPSSIIGNIVEICVDVLTKTKGAV